VGLASGKEQEQRLVVAVLTSIALLALSIRFYNLQQKGMCYWDEGIFFMGSKFLRWKVSGYLQDLAAVFGFSSELIDPANYEGYPVFLQKPVHILLLFISGLFLGVKPGLVFVHSVIYGAAAVWLTGWICTRIGGLTAGSIAALWLALEPYHVHYSRLGLHETDSMLLFLLGLTSWFGSLRSPGWCRLLVTGMLLMACFGSNYRYGLIIVILLVSDFYLNIVVSRGFLFTFRRLVFIGTGMAVVFLVLNGLYYVSFHPHYLWSQPATYMELLYRKFALTREFSFTLDHKMFYLDMMRRFDGWFPTSLLMTSVIFLAIRKGAYNRIIALFFLIQFILFSFMSPHLSRGVTTVLPFGAIAVGFSISEVTKFMTKRVKLWGLFPVVVVILFLLSFGIKLKPVYAMRSGYSHVFKYLDTHNVSHHLSTMKPIFASYRGRSSVAGPAFDLPDLRRQVMSTGVRYLVVDWQKYLRYPHSVMRIEEAILPVYAIENPAAEFFATLHENHFPEDVEKLRDIDPTLGYIKVYDLYDALPALGFSLESLGKDRVE